MSVFGITKAEMENAIQRECDHRASLMEKSMGEIKEHLGRLDADSKLLNEHDVKIDKLEKNLEKLSTEIRDSFDNIKITFGEEITNTRKHVDNQVDRAITQLQEADKRWEHTNTQLQDGMDTLNKSMTTLVETVADIGKRTDTIEQKPMKDAYEQQQQIKKQLAGKAFDILWKLVVLGAGVAVGASTLSNLF